MQVKDAVWLLEIHIGALAKVLALPVHQGVLDLQSREMAVVELAGLAAGLNAKAELRRQPPLPISGLLHPQVELSAAGAREVGQQAQQLKGRAGLQMGAVETSSIHAAAHGAAQGLQ